MWLKSFVDVQEMEVLEFTQLIHDVPAKVFADCELIQIYIFRSNTKNKNLDKNSSSTYLNIDIIDQFNLL